MSIVYTVNLVKKIKGTKSCGCLINKKNRLQKGEAAFNKVFRMYKQSAKTRKMNFNLTKEEIKELTRQRCHYCNSEPMGISKGKTFYGDYIYNGIDRVDNSIGYELDNCVSCCSMCNMMKRDVNINDFLKKIECIYNKSILANRIK